ncbi:3-deoxy-D-manno-octulosonic-acid transferase [Balneicella halophila]|uniref:3-deoxy-D-manno-octulosonic acid transferase n=1 Tax=Balneicella halophila TaxID=1537566 RepID=A0A7L4URB7_BALHA|nr:glycosyltransferase N-terminal domain-containing protein [Balneicella halophila]PVX52318.1 3-deoxy-D-manno-octulosonic-acid transferase [Balneicella halophila]
MKILYTIGIYLYAFLLKLVSPVHPKAKLWVDGRKGVFQKLENSLKTNQNPVIWMHVSSLGEFEQGRPLIEQIKQKYPEYKIVLTFFSPSGYEIRKDYPLADVVVYLPIDTPRNAKRFLNLVKPKKIFFVKYDFWYHYLSEAHRRNIPTYLISALFRENQLFFKPYGRFYRKILHFFTTMFVQDKNSVELLNSVGYNKAIIAGDTRVDRVADLAEQVQPIPYIDDLKQDALLLIAGSTWQPDEELLLSFFKKYHTSLPVKLIVAPHEIDHAHVEQLSKMFKDASISHIRYSSLSENTKVEDYVALIIDSIGLLSSLYQYGDIAYIGGGFGAGIHNTLEPATFGLPIIFGEKYHKFNEAVSLVALKGAFSINQLSELEEIGKKLLTDSGFREKSGNVAKAFISSQKGAVDIVISYCFSEK